MFFHRFVALAALTAFALNSAGTAFAQTPSPAPSPGATASTTPAPTAVPREAAGRDAPAHRIHLGIVSCEGAPFYSWPDQSVVPSGTIYPPARMSEAIHVIGDGTLSTNGMTLYETTIDVVPPFGIGIHYWISARCINAG